jgi:methylmalonyl-CoA mutase cobalamin-binding subunit
LRQKIVGCSLGNCIHVAGLLSFLREAERLGYETIFVGSAVPVDVLLDAVERHNPDLIAVSYRLTPEPARNLFAQLREGMAERGLSHKRLALGATPPVGEVGREAGIFERIFIGVEEPDEVLAYLKGQPLARHPEDYGSTLRERIKRAAPAPIVRHHFGQPTVAATVEGARRIAEAQAVDVISIAPDQNAQEHFFRPQEMKPELDGAGGVPLRSPDDLRAIYEASRCGNYPLVRCYAGTRDLIKWAEVHVETIDNAWGAIPLCWYNALDRRSNRPLEQAIAENIETIGWYADRDIPVECNEAHHWSLRSAHDTIAVAMEYLAAYVAKSVGVRTYVAQYMFNTPAATSPAMDLAKMLAKVEMIERLTDDTFQVVCQTRAGLLSFSPEPNVAKGQLAASTVLQLQLNPQIVHVVGFSEGHHAARVEDIVESCSIVRGVVHNALGTMPDMSCDPRVQQRREELVGEADMLLEALQSLGEGLGYPITSPAVLARAIKLGYLDAPDLYGNEWAAGRLVTASIDGAIRAVDRDTGKVLGEPKRLEALRAGA